MRLVGYENSKGNLLKTNHHKLNLCTPNVRIVFMKKLMHDDVHPGGVSFVGTVGKAKVPSRPSPSYGIIKAWLVHKKTHMEMGTYRRMRGVYFGIRACALWGWVVHGPWLCLHALATRVRCRKMGHMP